MNNVGRAICYFAHLERQISGKNSLRIKKQTDWFLPIMNPEKISFLTKPTV